MTHDALRQLALAATQPGPWTVKKEPQGKGRHSWRVIDANGFWLADFDDASANAAFVAAASPDVVVALLDEIAAANAEIERLTSAAEFNLEAWRQAHRQVEQLSATRAALGEACDVLDHMLVGKVDDMASGLRAQVAALRNVGAK
jgi:hypothetical protein